MRLTSIARRLRNRRSRGQSLVEFALVIPLLLMLTLIALDFGRVYLGWINLQSMTRIAANLAANNPDAWTGWGDADVKTRYQNQVKSDAAATNCHLPIVGGVETVPPPTFSDVNGDGSSTGLGDTAAVELTCTFDVITPGISDIVGGSVAVSASSRFPVKAGMTVAGGGGSSGVPPNAAFTGNSVVSPSSLSGPAPFTVVFRDTSGGYPTNWLWDFNDGTPNSTLRDPLDHVFTAPGTYIVTMTASNSWGSSTATMGITVTDDPTIDFVADNTYGPRGLEVEFTETAAPGGTNYAWDFGTGEGTGTGQQVTHEYDNVGTYSVTLTVTYPDGDKTLTKVNYINIDPGLCTVPSLNGVKRYDALGVWNDNDFSGTVIDGPGTPNGNYTITAQSLTAESVVPCSSNVTVSRP
jgi:PKD repeat protein